jgi:sulfite reductase (NADPH) flavoprotein alpha-component
MLSGLESIDSARLIAAAAILLAYAGFTVLCLRGGRRARQAPIDGVGDPQAGTAEMLVAFASQTGFAEQLAAQTARSLNTASTPVMLRSLTDLGAADLPQVERALFVVSTTGEGDAPDTAAGFVHHTLSRGMVLPNLRYGVLALGDREYDNFCAFGHRLDTWLRHQGATPLFDVIEVDNGDEGALRYWQHQLSVLSASPDLADWETPRYDRWRLTERHLLNPGSAGGPCFHVALEPCEGASAQWQAGDIAEIDPQNSTWNGPANAGNTAKPLLPHREYSIASLPEDGAIHLLIRQVRRPGGESGLGSGWLTQQATIGDEIALRIRGNSSFHMPAADRPLILIGNGTGIAGLRALLKARIAARRRRNWVLFGERNAAIDRFYGADLDAWGRQGDIEMLDLVFSRDQPERRYVQHRLVERAAELREWVAAGAAIYVCGSLQGMAPAVDSALLALLGADIMEQLAVQGGYRRDVY